MHRTARPHLSSVILTLALVSAGTGLACDPADDDAGFRSGDADAADADCTRPKGYWTTHHADAPDPDDQEPWPMPNTSVCDQTWLEILQTPADGDPWLLLAHQWIAACLNVGAGATPPDGDALTVAEAMLSNCSIADDAHDPALKLASQLAAYNNGDIGPGACQLPLGG